MPTRKELAFSGDASINVLFEHNGVLYTMKRTISDESKREETTLSSVRKLSQKLDQEEFLKNKLKVSLLDVLFAPEIIGGFKRLYSGDIDHSIGEMFRDIATVRAMVEKFSETHPEHENSCPSRPRSN